ncbi:hypothetical protein ACGFH8_06915 [Micromonospora sp. NPDC049175]|uniref:hypothetical protein n=1 Tax=Micromonospora sp. NPDC049175 TaxID=3364266 RepID=UPI0037173EF6
MSIELNHGQRRFEVMAYVDAMHDAQAIELAELASDGLGPALMTVLFTDEASADPRVLLDVGELPLPVLISFMAMVAEEQRRIAGAE